MHAGDTLQDVIAPSQGQSGRQRTKGRSGIPKEQFGVFDRKSPAAPIDGPMFTTQGVDADATRAGQEIRIAGLTLTGVGEWHAFNHDQMPTVNNVGIRFTADGEPTLYHPGDAYDGEAGEVDLLAVPVNAPWTAVRDSIGFVRRVAPTRIVPIHDGLLAPPGRALYLHHIGTFGGAEVLDLAGRGAVGVDA